MLNYTETTSIRTSVPSTEHERKTGHLPSLSVCLSEYVDLHIGEACYSVSSTLRDGYCAAYTVYAQMEEQDEYGPYLFLSGYEYTHLARHSMPAALPSTLKREWHREFVLGWNACTLVL